MDESQDNERFVLKAVVTPDLLTAQTLAGDLRTAARRWHVPVHEFMKLICIATIRACSHVAWN